jgi:hypothetical protein
MHLPLPQREAFSLYDKLLSETAASWGDEWGNRLGANLAYFSLTQPIRNDGLGGVLARIELRPLRLLRGVGFLRPDLDVLIAL